MRPTGVGGEHPHGQQQPWDVTDEERLRRGRVSETELGDADDEM